jgi:hypothetical protein
MFRFTIRDVLWLTALLGTIIALGGGWLNAERERRSSRYWKNAAESLASELERQGYQIELIENRMIDISHNDP